ncbi:MAG TPA: alpha/beta fold hydrolase [Gemmatimonadales bacterium]|jgi:hypothetical protein
MTGRILVRALLLIATAATTAIAVPLAAQQAPDRGAFIMRVGGDTIVLERFAWSADTLQGQIGVKGQPRTDYVAVTGPASSVRSMSISVFREAGTDIAPMRRVGIALRGDSIFVDVQGAIQAFHAVAGAVPLLNNSFAMAEIFTRKARAAGGPLDVPAFALSGGATIPVKLTLIGADSMTLSVAGSEERLRVDREGRILGGTIPSQHLEIIRVDPAAAASIRLGRTDYSASAGAPYTATEVTLTGPGGITLGGTLTIPIGARRRVPAVVTITGSGQQDRDEYIPVAGGYRPFRQVADTLGRRGIAVLRLDDRTVGLSGGALGTTADYADDIRAAVAYLRTRSDIDGDRLALVGHSEGGVIAPMVAATDHRLKGIVLLAGTAEKGSDVIHYQQRNAIEGDPSIPASARDSLIRAAAVAVDSIARTSRWLQFFLDYDPLIAARRVTVPVLILQGETDHQVTPDQARELAAAIRSNGNGDVTVHLFPGLDHLFVPDPSGQPAGYVNLRSGRVDPGVLGALADWLSVKLHAAN